MVLIKMADECMVIGDVFVVIVGASYDGGGSDSDDDGSGGSKYNYNDRGGRCGRDWQYWLASVVVVMTELVGGGRQG